MNYESNARENQDRFLLAVLDKKRAGTYVEVGGSYPKRDSNTYLLEKEFGWTGVSFELQKRLTKQWPAVRSNPCITCDATTIDYSRVFEKYQLPLVMDFLQLDIDPAPNTLKALKRIDLNTYKFRVLTFEHDSYRADSKIKEESRKIIQGLGYTLLVPDVTHHNLQFEDWYVREEIMPSDSWKRFIGVDPVFNTEHMKPETRKLLEL